MISCIFIAIAGRISGIFVSDRPATDRAPSSGGCPHCHGVSARHAVRGRSIITHRALLGVRIRQRDRLGGRGACLGPKAKTWILGSAAMIALLAGAIGYNLFAPRRTPPAQAPLALITAGNLGQFRKQFNAFGDVSRVLVLLSPT